MPATIAAAAAVARVAQTVATALFLFLSTTLLDFFCCFSGDNVFAFALPLRLHVVVWDFYWFLGFDVKHDVMMHAYLDTTEKNNNKKLRVFCILTNFIFLPS